MYFAVKIIKGDEKKEHLAKNPMYLEEMSAF
jgi:hypothetical protein